MIKGVENDIERVLVSKEEIKKIIKKLARQISEDYKDKNLLMVSVLKGSILFMSDLMKELTIHCRIDFMAMSSYAGGIKSKGVAKIVKDLDMSVEGYDVLIVEDILDSGITLTYIMELLGSRKPSSIKICTMLDKPNRRKTGLQADYVGKVIPDEFVIGFGLDYDEKYRNLPFVGVLKERVYKEKN